MIYLSFLFQQEQGTPVKDQGSAVHMKGVRCNGKMVSVSVNLQWRRWSVLLSCARSVWGCLTGGERVSWDRGAIAGPLREAGKGVFNGLVRYITRAALCQMLKTPESKGQPTVTDFSIVSREQWLQIASKSLPDTQVWERTGPIGERRLFIKISFFLSCAQLLHGEGGLWLSGLWKIQTSGLQNKLSCAMTPSNANQLCSRKAISMSASRWKLSDLNKGFFMKLRELFLSIGICLCHGEMSRMDFKVHSKDEIMWNKHFFFFNSQQPRERSMSA